MHEVFEYKFGEIASILGKSEAACRRSFSRAKAHLRQERPRFPASRQTHQQLLEGYTQAVKTGQMESLMDLLSEQVILWTDSGGKIKTAALNPIKGRDAVARFSLGTRCFWSPDYHLEQAEINGQSALLVYSGKQVYLVLTIEVEAGQIRAIRMVANPEKLGRV